MQYFHLTKNKEGVPVEGGVPLMVNFVELVDLQDLRFKGSSFTWHKGMTFEAFDRAIGNDA